MEKDNVKGVLKILRIMALIRSFIYLVGGILIIFFNKKLFDFIFIIVGIDIILLSSLDLLQEFLEFNNHRSNNRIGTSLLVLVIGVLILAIFNDDIYIVGVMWALSTILNSSLKINDGIGAIGKHRTFNLINLGFAVVEIVFSMLLLLEPSSTEEHFIIHIYLLGTSLLIESLEELIKMFSPFLIKMPGVNNIGVIQNLASEREEEMLKEEAELIAEAKTKKEEKEKNK